MRRDFVCPTCGKELRECPPPKKSNKGKVIAIIVALLVLIGAAVAYFLSGANTSEEPKLNVEKDSVPEVVTQNKDSEESQKYVSDTVINTSQSSDIQNQGSKVIKSTVQTTETTITTKTTSSVKNSSTGGRSTIKLSYGTYTGEIKNGYPNGMGRLTYSKTRQINRHDTKGRSADAGDYVIGEFVNGFFVQGKHYSSDGNLIESLIIGVSANDEYESK